MPLRVIDTDDLNPEDKTIPAVLQYDAAAGRFRLRDIINNSPILISAVEDNDLEDSFIDQVESLLEVDKITTRSYDGGSF
ncbi:hypothetical protein [Synechococcus phage S-B43]|nr:hypothetical protein [Synechococcus phage S-B43]QDH50485.1 hypothetical protein [Synechococcus phage S-B43]